MSTSAHQSIRHCLSMLSPFCPHPDHDAEGQRQFYIFIRGIYEDMLADPEAYCVFPAPYEEYMLKNRKRLEEMRGEKHHFSDSRESTLRNTFQQAIQFYAVFLWELGLSSLPEESAPGRIVLSQETHAEILQKMDKRHGSAWNTRRYQLLEQRGLRREDTKNRVYYWMDGAPRMIEGLLTLCKAKENKYKFMNYLRLDFKNAGSVPDMCDILSTLPDDSRDALTFLQKHAVPSLKLTGKLRPLRGITSDFPWKMEFSCRGKNVWSFYADSGMLKICLYFGGPDRISALADELLASDPALFAWYQAGFRQRLCKCPYNRAVRLGNIKRRICGLSNRMEMDHPAPTDLEKACLILKMLHFPAGN
ncbi:MAG: hypothetical protein E7324_03580 [Clostridiales bacterium]|nr:hypothetical protein [Clostridiales bacterium]